jgi:hypothetical protein
MTAKMFTYDHTCRQCHEVTRFEYSEGPYIGNGYDECDEGASDFAIQGTRGCLNAASVDQGICDPEDVCTVTDEQLTDAAHDSFCESWRDNYNESQYLRRYND